MDGTATEAQRLDALDDRMARMEQRMTGLTAVTEQALAEVKDLAALVGFVGAQLARAAAGVPDISLDF